MSEREKQERSMRDNWMIAIIITLIVLNLYFAFAIPGITSQQPLNNSFLQGNTSEQFLIQSNETLTTASVYIDGIETVMNCTLTVCSAIKNFAFIQDNTTHQYFFVANSIIYPTNVFFIDRVPEPVQNATAIGNTETSILVQWNALFQQDVSHSLITRNGQFLVNTTQQSFTDYNLTTGQQYNYTIIVVDGRGQKSSSVSVNATPQDMTPPQITFLEPPTGSLFQNNQLQINVSYSENVTLQLLAGVNQLLIQGMDDNHTLALQPIANGTYYFLLNATDNAGNSQLTPYIAMIGSNVTQLNVTIVSIPGIMEVCYMLKSSAFAQGSDAWIVQCDLVLQNVENVTIALSDLQGSQENIDISNETQPMAYCKEDYDSQNMRLKTVPQYNVISVQNTPTSIVFNCPDTNPTSAVVYSVVWQIPVPLGKTADLYSFVYEWFYDVV